MIRILKHNPEMILDNVEGDLTTADRASNKGREAIVGIIKKKLFGLHINTFVTSKLDKWVLSYSESSGLRTPFPPRFSTCV